MRILTSSIYSWTIDTARQLVLVFLVCFIPQFNFLAKSHAQGIMTTVAGGGWTFRGDGGSAATAQLATVVGMAFDSTGNLYAADGENQVVIKVSPGRQLTVVAGNGIRGFSGDGGPASSASLRYPSAVAVDSAGNIYIADSHNNRVRKVSGGTISTVAGNGASDFTGDGGPATLASLREPSGVAVDAAGNLYISDYGNSRIRRVAPNGIITTVAGNGSFDFFGDGGPAGAARLAGPRGLAIDAPGTLYIADEANDRIRKISAGIISTVAGGGELFIDNIPGTSARLGSPVAVALDGAGNFYIVARYNYVIRRVTSAGTITSVAGNGDRGYSADGGPALAEPLNLPFGVAANATGIYIADTGNHRIRKVTGGIISTWAGNGLGRFLGDGGPAVGSALNRPQGVEVDNAGNLYIADVYNNRIRKIAPNGIISTVAGNGLYGFSGDGGPAGNASLGLAVNLLQDSTNLFNSMATDASGNLYFPDPGNNRVRKISTTGIITTVAGNGDCCFSGDGTATSYSLYGPSSVAVDAANNLYIADTYNERIRKVNLNTGLMTTVAGNGTEGFSGDGGAASAAKLYSPLGVAVDSIGNIFISDSGNQRIRRVTPGGIISTFAGDGNYGSSGDGGPATAARFTGPRGLALDAVGNLFVSDGGQRVRRITAAGIISTVAGPGVPDNLCDGGQAITASLNEAHEVTVDAGGNLYIADTLNDRIRKVLAQPPSFAVSPTALTFTAPAGTQSSASQLITLSSSVPGLFWQLTALTQSGGDWLIATPSDGTLPRQVSVSVDARRLAQGTYRARIEFNAPAAPSLLVGVDITLIVTAPAAAALSIQPNQLTIEAILGAPAPVAQTLRIVNPGGGTLNWTAAVSTSSGGTWLSLSANTGTASAQTPGSTDARINLAGLTAGIYSGTIVFSSPDTSQSETVHVTLLISQAQQIMLLSQRGLAFTVVEGGGAPPPQTFGVLNTGQGAMSWLASAETYAGGNWLSLSADAGTSIGGSMQPPLLDVRVSVAGLQAGTYSGQIRVASSGANNAPQFVTVTLTVLPRGSNPGVVVRPTGLIFVRQAGSSSPASQTVGLATSLPGSVQVGITPATLSGGNWLDVLPRNVNVSSSDPRVLTVQPTLGTLTPGEYFGALTLLFSDLTSQTVNVLFVVTPPGTAQQTRAGQEKISDAGIGPADDANCVPQRLFATVTSLSGSFNLPVGFPASILAQVRDDCGNPVSDAQVTARFDNGDSALVLNRVGEGNYQESWQPASAGQANRNGPVRITLRAARIPLVAAETSVGGQVYSNTTMLPSVNSGGVVNAASSASGEPLAPGSILSLYGANLASASEGATTAPLPTTLADATLNIGGREVPLFYSSAGQINAQLPFDLPPNSRQHLFVRVRRADGAISASVPESIAIASARPAIFTVNQQGSGQAAILNQDFFVNSSSNPAVSGSVVQIFATGLGATNPPVLAGQQAPASPLSLTTSPVQATIGGLPATVQFSGLAPGFVGLYQINVVIPAGVQGGADVPLVLTQDGVPSNTVTLAIR